MVDVEIGLGLQTPESEPIKSHLKDFDIESGDVLRASFAYVTERGVAQLEDGLSNTLTTADSKWLVSFDYGYTEPESIRQLDKIGEVRVVGVEQLREQGTLKPATRFHPKFIWIQEGEDHHLMVGSSNLTESALTSNWESVFFIRPLEDNNPQIKRLSSWWGEVWEESTPVNEELLDWYEDIRENADIGPAKGAEDHDKWADAPEPRDASIVWARIGYTQSGSRNQMDIPTQFGWFFLEEGDTWELDTEREVSFLFEGEEIEGQKVKYHEGSYQTRIYLPTETQGTRLKELYKSDKFDETGLRYYFAVFRRVGPYRFKLRILPPEGTSEIREIVEESKQRDQVVETDEETGRLVGWL